jgi:small nuclear ribonucleoprotein (snRNP)-like protein
MNASDYKRGLKSLAFALQSLEGSRVQVELRNEQLIEGILVHLDSSLK